MPTRSLADALAYSAAGPLLARLAKIKRITQTLAAAVARIAPDFDAHDPWACELREEVLTLNARSAAQAAKLRQGIPGLLRLLHQQGAQVTEIRVKVQPTRTTYPESANDPAQVSPNGGSTPAPDPAVGGLRTPSAVAGASAFAEALARDLPDSALGQAAARLQARLARVSRRGD
jgi:hypothetical protein